MGLFKKIRKLWTNSRPARHGLASNSDYFIYDEKKEMHVHRPLWPLITKILLPGFIVAGSLFLYGNKINSKNSFNVPLFDNSIVYAQQAPKTDTLFEENDLGSENQKQEDTSRVIYLDNLQKSNTVFENTNVLKIGPNGIKVSSPQFAVLYNGKDYLPDADNYIQLPKKAIGKKLRFVKLNPNEPNNKDPTKKYLASFPTHAEKAPRSKSLFGPKPKTIEHACNLELNNSSKSLESKVAQINYEQNISYPAQGKLTSELARKLYEKRFKTIKKNKDGILRSDIVTLKQLVYENNRTFDETIEYQKSCGLSNRQIAKKMTEYAGINVNPKQVSDSLKNNSEVPIISKKEYDTNRWYYNSSFKKVKIYDGNQAMITITNLR